MEIFRPLLINLILANDNSYFTVSRTYEVVTTDGQDMRLVTTHCYSKDCQRRRIRNYETLCNVCILCIGSKTFYLKCVVLLQHIWCITDTTADTGGLLVRPIHCFLRALSLLVTIVTPWHGDGRFCWGMHSYDIRIIVRIIWNLNELTTSLRDIGFYVKGAGCCWLQLCYTVSPARNPI